LLTGKVDTLFDNLPGVVEFVKAGKLRALGVTTAKRNTALPDVPAVGETVKGYEAIVFYGVAGPKGMPPEIVAILNKAFNEALADPKIQKRIADLGAEPMPMTPEQFGKLTSDETEKWAKVVKAANLSIE
jgi:tripartite-type tricarboxylate transporter receptor subunit TctC